MNPLVAILAPISAAEKEGESCGTETAGLMVERWVIPAVHAVE